MMANRVWVVGGTSGIGAAVADLLELSQTWEVERTGTKLDVRNSSGLVNFAREFRPTALIYSAGINKLEWSHEIVPEDMVDLYDVNVAGLVRCLKAAHSTLERAVVVGSDAAWRPMRQSTMYCASKAALHMAVRCIARERASDGFVINLVAPGVTDLTNMTNYVDEQVQETRPDLNHFEYELSQIPAKRRAHPLEIAAVVHWLLEHGSDYFNGAIIPINGAR